MDELTFNLRILLANGYEIVIHPILSQLYEILPILAIIASILIYRDWKKYVKLIYFEIIWIYICLIITSLIFIGKENTRDVYSFSVIFGGNLFMLMMAILWKLISSHVWFILFDKYLFNLKIPLIYFIIYSFSANWIIYFTVLHEFNRGFYEYKYLSVPGPPVLSAIHFRYGKNIATWVKSKVYSNFSS